MALAEQQRIDLIRHVETATRRLGNGWSLDFSVPRLFDDVLVRVAGQPGVPSQDPEYPPGVALALLALQSDGRLWTSPPKVRLRWPPPRGVWEAVCRLAAALPDAYDFPARERAAEAAVRICLSVDDGWPYASVAAQSALKPLVVGTVHILLGKLDQKNKTGGVIGFTAPDAGAAATDLLQWFTAADNQCQCWKALTGGGDPEGEGGKDYDKWVVCTNRHHHAAWPHTPPALAALAALADKKRGGRHKRTVTQGREIIFWEFVREAVRGYSDVTFRPNSVKAGMLHAVLANQELKTTGRRWEIARCTAVQRRCSACRAETPTTKMGACPNPHCRAPYDPVGEELREVFRNILLIDGASSIFQHAQFRTCHGGHTVLANEPSCPVRNCGKPLNAKTDRRCFFLP